MTETRDEQMSLYREFRRAGIGRRFAFDAATMDARAVIAEAFARSQFSLEEFL